MSNPCWQIFLGEEKLFPLAKKALKGGEEVDFGNKILKDPSFVGTKADCVLEVLLKQTGYFKDVMDVFTNDNSKYRIKFIVGTLSDQNHGGEAQTSAPNSKGIVNITITSGASSGNALDIAGFLLHEGVHAQLYRLLATGNKTQYNISTKDYNWLKNLNEWWKNKSKFPIATAQHDFMAVRYVNPIANAVRRYDANAQPIVNYMYFGWNGLYDETSNRGLIDMKQFNSYIQLAQLPLKNDKHKTSCD